jgi:hypothetical protein
MINLYIDFKKKIFWLHGHQGFYGIIKHKTWINYIHALWTHLSNLEVLTSQELLHKPGINNANAATIKARDDDKALVDKYLPTKWTL